MSAGLTREGLFRYRKFELINTGANVGNFFVTVNKHDNIIRSRILPNVLLDFGGKKFPHSLKE